jgi:hypothetical protein
MPAVGMRRRRGCGVARCPRSCYPSVRCARLGCLSAGWRAARAHAHAVDRRAARARALYILSTSALRAPMLLVLIEKNMRKMSLVG